MSRAMSYWDTVLLLKELGILFLICILSKTLMERLKKQASGMTLHYNNLILRIFLYKNSFTISSRQSKVWTTCTLKASFTKT